MGGAFNIYRWMTRRKRKAKVHYVTRMSPTRVRTLPLTIAARPIGGEGEQSPVVKLWVDLGSVIGPQICECHDLDSGHLFLDDFSGWILPSESKLDLD